MYCFLALNAEKISEQSLDDGEDIEIRLVPMDKLVDMMKNGEISHALQLAALFHALVHMERIR